MASFGARVGGALIAGVLIATGAGFTVAAVYLSWRELLPAPLAALVTAACLFAVAGVVHLATRASPQSAPPPSPLAKLLPALALIRAKPSLSVLGALALGALLEQLDRPRK